MTYSLVEIKKSVAALVGSAVVAGVAIVGVKLGLDTVLVSAIDAALVGLVARVVFLVPNQFTV